MRSTDWIAVWHELDQHQGCTHPGSNGETTPEFEAASAWAINLLLDAGYKSTDSDKSEVEIAQTYLMLAALHCPTLVTTPTEV